MTERTSVVIPCYNGQAFLLEALESVRSQTRPVREVLIIDDGSTEPVRAPEAWDGPPVRVVRTPNRGLPAARNLGIDLATGDFIGLLDADDAWHPRKVELQEEAITSTPGAVASFCLRTAKPGWPPCDSLNGTLPPADLTDSEFFARLWQRNFIAPSTMLLRRDVVIQVGGFDESLRAGEDWECWCRLAAAGRVVQVAEPLCYYRLHPDQMSKKVHHMVYYTARQKIVERHGSRLEAIGISRELQLQAVREEHRMLVLYAYFQRDLAAARRLLWGYFLRNPSDLTILKYAILSLLPRGLLVRLAD